MDRPFLSNVSVDSMMTNFFIETVKPADSADASSPSGPSDKLIQFSLAYARHRKTEERARVHTEPAADDLPIMTEPQTIECIDLTMSSDDEGDLGDLSDLVLSPAPDWFNGLDDNSHEAIYPDNDSNEESAHVNQNDALIDMTFVQNMEGEIEPVIPQSPTEVEHNYCSRSVWIQPSTGQGQVEPDDQNDNGPRLPPPKQKRQSLDSPAHVSKQSNVTDLSRMSPSLVVASTSMETDSLLPVLNAHSASSEYIHIPAEDGGNSDNCQMHQPEPSPPKQKRQSTESPAHVSKKPNIPDVSRVSYPSPAVASTSTSVETQCASFLSFFNGQSSKEEHTPSPAGYTDINRLYKCPDCPYTSTSSAPYQYHVLCHHAQGLHKCPHCTFSVIKEYQLARHVKVHEISSFLDERPDIKRGALVDKLRYDINTGSVSVNKKVRAGTTLCPKCPTRHTYTGFHSHLTQHGRKGMSLNCIFCDYASNRTDYMRSHIEDHVKDQQSRENNEPVRAVASASVPYQNNSAESGQGTQVTPTGTSGNGNPNQPKNPGQTKNGTPDPSCTADKLVQGTQTLASPLPTTVSHGNHDCSRCRCAGTVSSNSNNAKQAPPYATTTVNNSNNNQPSVSSKAVVSNCSQPGVPSTVNNSNTGVQDRTPAVSTVKTYSNSGNKFAFSMVNSNSNNGKPPTDLSTGSNSANNREQDTVSTTAMNKAISASTNSKLRLVVTARNDGNSFKVSNRWGCSASASRDVTSPINTVVKGHVTSSNHNDQARDIATVTTNSNQNQLAIISASSPSNLLDCVDPANNGVNHGTPGGRSNSSNAPPRPRRSLLLQPETHCSTNSASLSCSAPAHDVSLATQQLGGHHLITNIKVENIMCLNGQPETDVSSIGILRLKGPTESGKSSFILAVMLGLGYDLCVSRDERDGTTTVCGLNIHDAITNGKDYASIELTLSLHDYPELATEFGQVIKVSRKVTRVPSGISSGQPTNNTLRFTAPNFYMEAD